MWRARVPICSRHIRVLQPALHFRLPLWSRTALLKVRRDVKIAFAWDGELSEMGLEAKERYLMEVI
jgi:hypothetical protein